MTKLDKLLHRAMIVLRKNMCMTELWAQQATQFPSSLPPFFSHKGITNRQIFLFVIQTWVPGTHYLENYKPTKNPVQIRSYLLCKSLVIFSLKAMEEINKRRNWYEVTKKIKLTTTQKQKNMLGKMANWENCYNQYL